MLRRLMLGSAGRVLGVHDSERRGLFLLYGSELGAQLVDIFVLLSS